MNKNIVKLIAILVMCFVLCAVLVACKGETGAKGDTGAAGAPGVAGVGIEKAEINANGHLILTYTDGKTADLGNVVGADGEDGEDGEKGDTGAAAPVCENHTFDKINVETTDGKWFSIEACTACGWAQLGCGHKNYTSTYTPNTCKDGGHVGFTTNECDDCDFVWVVEDENAPALTHTAPAFDKTNIDLTVWTKTLNNTGTCDCVWAPVYVAACTACGDEVVATADAPGHVYTTYEEAINNSGMSDCEWIPIEVAKCDVCGDTEGHDGCSDANEVGTAPGHTWGAWTIATAPTATTAGEAVRVCDVCGATHANGTEKLTLPVLTDSAYAYVENLAAECDADGKGTFTYTHTDLTTVDVEVVLPELGHTYTVATVTKVPTRAGVDGEITIICDVCSHEHKEVIPATIIDSADHITATGTCTALADTYAYTVKFNEEETGEEVSLNVTFQVNGTYVHDEAPAKEDCQKVEGTDKWYYVYKCDKCETWVVAYYENK